MITYELAKDGEDKSGVTLRKKGIEVTFTPAELIRDKERAAKMLKEIEANRLVKDAVAKNIENNNEWIKDMELEKLHACHMYYEATAFVREADKKIPDFKKFLEEMEQEMNEIEFQIPEVEGVFKQYENKEQNS